MTLQIAIEGRDGFVLASDLKTMTTGESQFVKPGTLVSYPIYEHKITVNEKHQIAIALAGQSPYDDVSESEKLSNELEKLEHIPEAFDHWLEDWGNRYIEAHPLANCSLLIVNPAAKESIRRIIAVRLLDRPCSVNSRWPWALHPNQTTPANFWPQLFKVDQKPHLHCATKIAALTILMAGALHNGGIGKLELYQFSGRWQPLREEEINQIENKFLSIMDAIEETVNG